MNVTPALIFGDVIAALVLSASAYEDGGRFGLLLFVIALFLLAQAVLISPAEWYL